MIVSSIRFNALSLKTLGLEPLPKIFSQGLLTSISSRLYCKNASVLSSIKACSSPDPSQWGDRFLLTSPSDLKPDIQFEERIVELKKEIQRMLHATAKEPLQEMKLINTIQRLGFAYHFESEIEDALGIMYNDRDGYINFDLYGVALRFRLLRQAGYYVSPDVFKRFKNEIGQFHAKMSNDVIGMLSLYEAAHVGFHGEDILDEAITFTTHHLKLMVTQLSPILAREVKHALELPLHKRFLRMEAREYISMYQEDKSRNELLLEFAKLDFNMVQSVHLRELDQVSRWWREVDLINKQPFPTRDRLIESYAMSLAIFFEPKHSTGRICTTKLTCYLSVLDDYFDVHGKMDQLELLTDAILRWDIKAMNALPEYMKLTVSELCKTLHEIDQVMIQRGQPYTTDYIKQEIQNYTRNVMEELKLMESGRVPKLEELYRLSKVTVGASVTVVGVVVDSHEYASKEALDWIINWPEILNTTSWICRIHDDLCTFKFERKRGLDISGVTCYMEEHGVSELKAIEHLRKMSLNKWKDLNRLCMRSTFVPMRLLMLIRNLACLVEVFYKNGDGFTNPTSYTKHIIELLLANSIPI